jgi:hypothetical protein
LSCVLACYWTKKGADMVEILDSSTESCVVVRFGGKVKGDEYKAFLDAVDERLKNAETIDMVADISEFEFYGDMKAAEEDFRFGTREYRKVRRAALVGDQRWIDLVLKLMGPFYKAEEKHFASGDLDAAVTWATA